MAEGLMNRVKRLVSGSVNSIVDAVENAAPEAVMKEAIREIDSAIDDVRDQLGRVIANKHHANKRLMEANAKHEDLAEKLRLAVDQGRDDLAEAAIARQLDLEAQMPVLEDALKDTSAEEAELEAYISALAGRRREMEEDLQTYLASRPTESESAPAARDGQPDRKVENAETAFNRVLRGATGVPGTANADRDTAAKLAELETVSRENRIKERLAALKAVKSAD
ncbi:MAG: PspA/IM30 family protein [Pseudomonadota bacterium]